MRAIAFALCLAASPLAAQTDEPAGDQTAAQIEEARQAYNAGYHALALTVLIPAAEAGNADAQNVYGIALRDGAGVEADAVAARDWYEKAAAQGHLKASHNLARLYQYGGEGVPQDHDKARALYEEIIGDYPQAGAALGLMYERGEGVEKDPARAAEYYAMGAGAEEPHALYNLANAHRTGTGVEEDLPRALELYTRSALAGHDYAANALGLMFQYGMATEPNPDAAYTAYRMAVNRGLALAGINLGKFVTETEGWWQDPVHGYGYCLWGVNNASDEEKEGFIGSCEPLVEYLSVEEEDAAKRFAEQIGAE